MKPDQDFEATAKASNEGSFIGELWGFIRANRKYWLIPIVLALLVLGLFILLSGTAVAPFIYTLF